MIEVGIGFFAGWKRGARSQEGERKSGLSGELAGWGGEVRNLGSGKPRQGMLGKGDAGMGVTGRRA